MSNRLQSQKVVVVGGATGMGLAIAKICAAEEAEVVIASRNEASLRQAAEAIGPHVRFRTVDTTSEESVIGFFRELGPIDHLTIPGSSVRTAPLQELSQNEAELTMRSKFWGPYLCAKHAQMSPAGSITFFSGILSRKPGKHNAILCAVNSAVEALGRALAVELAPVRVNTLSPGMTAGTQAYNGMPDEARQAMFDAVASRLPVGRVGATSDIAEAVVLLMTNAFITGTVLDIDGGGLLV